MGNPDGIGTDCAPIVSESCHSDCCPGLRFEAADRSPGPVDLLQSSRCPAIPETGFPGSLQSCELWIDCKFNATLRQSIRIASESQPLAINPTKLDRGTTDTKWQDGNPDRNLHNRIKLRQYLEILGIVVELQIPGNPTAGADGLQSAIEIGPLLQPIPDCGTVDPKATTSNWIAIGLQNYKGLQCDC